MPLPHTEGHVRQKSWPVTRRGREGGTSVATGTPVQMFEHFGFDNNIRKEGLCTFEGRHFKSKYTIGNSDFCSAAIVTS